MLQERGKYLYILNKSKEGLDVHITILVSLIQTALIMKRIPIIMQASSSQNHRSTNKNIKQFIDWERYINLSKTKIFKVEPSGAIKELPDVLQYVHERDFDFDSYQKNQIRFIDKSQIYDMDNESYPVIYMRNSRQVEHTLSRKKRKSLEFPKISRTAPRAKFNSPYLMTLLPSEIVNNLTDVVLNHFGTSRANMEILSSILYGLPRVQYSNTAFDYIDLNCYACMHVRYGVHWRYASKLIKETTRLREEIERVVKIVYERNDKTLPLYIMSNVMESDYFDFLKPQYDIYRYTDFKELKELFNHKEEIDHNLLYSVEKNIMRYATVRILSHNKNMSIFEYPWQYS